MPLPRGTRSRRPAATPARRGHPIRVERLEDRLTPASTIFEDDSYLVYDSFTLHDAADTLVLSYTVTLDSGEESRTDIRANSADELNRITADGVDLSPPANWSGTFTYYGTLTYYLDGYEEFEEVAGEQVTVIPVPDEPALSVDSSPVSVTAGDEVTLDVSFGPSEDDDGSEAHTLYVNGVPPGATLSAGAPLDEDPRVWVITGGVNGLTLSLPASTPHGSYELSFTPYTDDDGYDAGWSEQTLTLNVAFAGVTFDEDTTHPVSETTTVESGAYGFFLSVEVIIDSRSHHYFYVTDGFDLRGTDLTYQFDLTPPPNWSGTITYTAQLNYLYDVTVTEPPSEEYPGGRTYEMTYSAGQRLLGPTFLVNPVPDLPDLIAEPGGRSVFAGEGTDLGLSLVGSEDRDGSEYHALIISGVPSGAVLSAGTPAGEAPGVWVVPAADVYGLILYLPAATAPGDYALTATPFTDDGGVTRAWDDLARPLTLTVFAPSVVSVRHPQFTINEDEPSTLVVGEDTPFALSDNDPAGGDYTTVLEAVNGGLVVNQSLAGQLGLTVEEAVTPPPHQNRQLSPNGVIPVPPVVPAGSPRVTITGSYADLRTFFFAAGAFRFVPTAQFSGAGSVTLTVSGGGRLRGTDTIDVRINPVADEPAVALPEGGETTLYPGVPGSIGVTLDPSADADGSEEHFLDITGYPEGTEFSDGYEMGEGVWRVPAHLLPYLTVTVPADAVPGTWVLTLTPVTFDTADFGADPDVDIGIEDLGRGAAAGFDAADIGGYGGLYTVPKTWGTRELVLVVGELSPTDPVVRPPSYYIVDENSSAYVSGFELNDPDADGREYTATVTATHGTVWVNPFDLEFTGAELVGDDNEAATIVLRGTLTELRDLLQYGPGVRFTPDRSFAGDANVRLTLADPDGHTGRATARVDVYPRADSPVVTAPPRVLVAPGQTRSLGLSAELSLPGDRDGSDRLRSAYIYNYGSSLPTGATLGGAGADDGSGTWVLDAADLPRLTITVPAGAAGDYTLYIDVEASDAAFIHGDEQASFSYTSLFLTVRVGVGVAPGLEVGGGPMTNAENQAIRISAFKTFGLSDADDDGGFYTVTFDGATPAGDATFSADYLQYYPGVSVSGNGTSRLRLTGPLASIRSYLDNQGVLHTPPRYFSGDTSFTVTLTDTDGLSSPAATVPVAVYPAPEMPTLTATGPTGPVASGAPFPLAISATPVDPDGSEVVPYVDVFGFPDGTTFNKPATNIGYGAWRFATADLAGLTVTLPASFGGELRLEVYAAATDTATLASLPDPVEYSSYQSFAVVTLTAVAPPTVSAPELVTTDEGYWAYFSLTVSHPGADPSGIYTVRLSSPAGRWNVNPTYLAQRGVTTAGDGTGDVTLTGRLNRLHDFFTSVYLSGFPDYFSGMVTGITFTVTEVATGRAGTTAAAVRVRPRASEIGLTGVTPQATPVDTPVTLRVNPTATPGDQDETVWVYVAGLPAGAVLSAGSAVPAGAGLPTLPALPSGGPEVVAWQWRLTPAQLRDLRLTPPPGFAGEFTLRFAAVTTDPDPVAPTVPATYTFPKLEVLIRVGVAGAAPVVTAAPSPTIYEGGTAYFGGYNFPGPDGGVIPLFLFDITDPDADGTGQQQQTLGPTDTTTPAPPRLYTVEISTDRGFIGLVNPDYYRLTLLNGYQGQTVRVRGTLADVRRWLSEPSALDPNYGYTVTNGFYAYSPNYYSGEVRVSVTVFDPDGFAGGATTAVKVRPYASSGLCVMPDRLVRVYAGDSAPVAIEIDPLPDADGSEADVVYLESGLVGAGGTFSAGSRVQGADRWRLTRAELPGLRVNQPAGLTGVYNVYVYLEVTDTATYPTLGGVESSVGTSYGFFEVSGVTPPFPTLTLPPTAEIGEDGSFTYRENVTLADDDGNPDDVYTVELSVYAGLYYLGAGTLEVLPGDRTGVTITGENPEGTTHLWLSGTLADLNRFFAETGFRYTPAANASGEFFLRGYATDADFNPHTDYALQRIDVKPVAEVPTLTLVPSVPPQRSGDFLPDDWLAVAANPDTDGSEGQTVTVYFEGVSDPYGFSFSAGYQSYDGASYFWVLTRDQLAGLQLFTPAGFGGVATLRVVVYHTDGTTFPSRCLYLPDGKQAEARLPVRVYAGDRSQSIPPVWAYEGQTRDLTYSFSLNDQDYVAGDTHRVALTVGRGTLHFGGTVPAGVTLAGNDTATVTLEGDFSGIQDWLRGVFGRFLEYVPDPADRYYSGEVSLAVELTDVTLVGRPGYRSGLGTGVIKVLPVADPVAAPEVILGTQNGTTIPLAITVPPVTTDTDGSERVTAVQVAYLPDGVRLSKGTHLGNGIWQVDVADLPGLDLDFADSGFHGFFSLYVNAVVTDTATYPTLNTTESAYANGLLSYVSGRYVGGGVAAAAGPVSGAEGATIPIGAALTLTDPDAVGESDSYPGDVHTLTVTVSRGTLTLPYLDVDELTDRLDIASPGESGRTVVVTGDLTDIRAWLARGDLSYTPAAADAHFSGEVGLTVTLTNDTISATPGYVPGSGIGVVQVLPVAAGVPAPGVAAGTQAGTSIPLAITLPPVTVDTDGSEAVTAVRLAGLPAGARPSKGTALGGGVWEVAAADLPGLTLLFADSGFRGRFTLTVTPVVTDTASYPTLGTTENATALGSPATLSVRYFGGGATVTTTDAPGTEGASPDLAGTVTVSDPDTQSGDLYTVTLTVPTGGFAFDLTVPPVSGFTANIVPGPVPRVSTLTATVDGGTLTATGTLADVVAFLGTAGRLRYVPPSPTFAGGVPVSVLFANLSSPLPAATGAFGIRVAPVASLLVPVTAPAATDEERPVALSITVPPSGDPRETFVVIVRGVPEGAALLWHGEPVGVPLGGGAFQISPAHLAGLTLVPPELFAGVIRLTASVVTTDSVDYAPLSGSAADTRTSPDVPLDVTVRLLPTNVTLTGGSVPENSLTGTAVGRVIVTGGHPRETFTLRLVSTGGYNFTVDPDGTIKVGTENPDYEARPGFSMTVEAVGSRGTRVSQVYPVTITDVNEPPVVVAPAPANAREDAVTSLTGLSVSDPDAAAYHVHVTLSVTRGTLTVTVPYTTAAAVYVAGNGGPSVLLDGTLAAINALLATTGAVAYRPPADFSGVETLTIEADDRGHSGAGGVNVTRVVRTFPVAPVADLPDLTVVGTAAGDEDTDIPLDVAGAVTDTDGSETLAYLVSGVPAGGRLTRGEDRGNGVWALAAADLAGLAFRPPPDASGVFTLTVTAVVTDTAPDTVLVDQITRTADIVVTVRGIADPPRLAVRDLTMDEGTEFTPNLGVTSGDRDGSETVTVVVRGVPAGLIVRGGRYDAENDEWVFTPEEFARLELLSPRDTDGKLIELTAVATSVEAEGGPAATVEQRFRVLVRNVAPKLPGQFPAGGTTGTPLTLDLGSIADPGDEPGWSVTIDWGDGTSDTLTAARAVGSLGHTYGRADSYVIRVSVTDDDDTTVSNFLVSVVDPPAEVAVQQPSETPAQVVPEPTVEEPVASTPATPAATPVFAPNTQTAAPDAAAAASPASAAAAGPGAVETATPTAAAGTEPMTASPAAAGSIMGTEDRGAFAAPGQASRMGTPPPVGTYAAVSPANLTAGSVAQPANPLGLVRLNPAPPSAGFGETAGDNFSVFEALAGDAVPLTLGAVELPENATATATPRRAADDDLLVAGMAGDGTDPEPAADEERAAGLWPLVTLFGVTSALGVVGVRRPAWLRRLIARIRRAFAVRLFARR